MRNLGLAGLLAIATALVLAGCGGSDGPGEGPTAEYLPGAIGNQWVYSVTDYEAATAQVSDVRRPFLRARRPAGEMNAAQALYDQIITITDTETIGGSEWFVATLGWSDSSVTEDRYFRHDYQGLLWRDERNVAGYYRILTPLTVGHDWTDPLDSRRWFEIVATSERVVTEAGTFNRCLVVDDIFEESGQPDDIIRSWFAPNIGLVKEQQHIGSNLVYESELSDYDLTNG